MVGAIAVFVVVVNPTYCVYGVAEVVVKRVAVLPAASVKDSRLFSRIQKTLK